MELYLVDAEGNIYEGVRATTSKSAEFIARNGDNYVSVKADLEFLVFEAKDISKLQANIVSITIPMLEGLQKAEKVVRRLAEIKAKEEGIDELSAYEAIVKELAE